MRYQLSEAERSVFIDLLVLAGRSRTPGVIQANVGEAYPLSIIAQRLNIGYDSLQETMKKLVEQNRVFLNNNAIHIVNWVKYQPPERPDRSVKQTVEELSPEPQNPLIARLSELYEKEIGTISPTIANEFGDFAKEYSDMPPNWITEAFAEAATNNKRNWAYVKAILKSWKEEGKHARQPKATKRHNRDLPAKHTPTPDYGD